MHSQFLPFLLKDLVTMPQHTNRVAVCDTEGSDIDMVLILVLESQVLP